MKSIATDQIWKHIEVISIEKAWKLKNENTSWQGIDHKVGNAIYKTKILVFSYLFVSLESQNYITVCPLQVTVMGITYAEVDPKCRYLYK